jgi:peptidoglycan/xylan/chitin deacetylase (PgdA/CDA1 family)
MLKQFFYNSHNSINLPILMYHEIIAGENTNSEYYEISLRQFQQQLDQLQCWGFTVITLGQLVRVLDGKENGPARPVVITFDDAYRSFLELALPELRHRDLTATLFVTAGEIGGTNRWDQERGFPKRPVMTAAELRICKKAGIEIGAHGWLHRKLTQCSRAEAEEEIVRSRDVLARCLGTPPVFYSYPHGVHLPENFEMLAKAGYHGAVSIFSDAPTVTANRYAMRRVYIHPGDTTLRFRLKLSGMYLRYKAWREAPHG